MATQGERRAETRQRLLDAAADLFATRGIEASSVDAIAERAQRTSGAIYDHFGGKEGLLFALLEGWVDDVAAVISAELVAAPPTLDDRLAAIWRNVTEPPTGRERWILLEHELWSFAARDERARDHLARRYQELWSSIDGAVAEWAEEEGRAAPDRSVGAAVVGVLIGLEMMRRVDPTAIDDHTAVATLRGAIGTRLHEEISR